MGEFVQPTHGGSKETGMQTFACGSGAIAPNAAAATRTITAFIGAAAGRRGASFRRANAAQVCSNVGSVVVDGVSECSITTAARQIVSERW